MLQYVQSGFCQKRTCSVQHIAKHTTVSSSVFSYVVNVQTIVEFTLEGDNKTFYVVGPVNRMVVGLQKGNVCTLKVIENDAYDFGGITFDAPGVEKFLYYVQLVLQLDSHAFVVFILGQKYSIVSKQSRLSFRIIRHIIDIGKIESGREAGALRDSCKKISGGRETVFYFGLKYSVG